MTLKAEDINEIWQGKDVKAGSNACFIILLFIINIKLDIAQYLQCFYCALHNNLHNLILYEYRLVVT